MIALISFIIPVIAVISFLLWLIVHFDNLQRYWKSKCADSEIALNSESERNSNIYKEYTKLHYAYEDSIKSCKENIEQLKTSLAKEVGRNKSVEVRTGMIMEKLVPFLEVFKHNPSNSVFLGQPIDYICFSDDEITIIEVKTGDSKMTPKQRQIKKLIEEGKVKFELIRIGPGKVDKDSEQ
jgi:predicted Holliday junction resolvase-like endonuclease